MSRSLRELDLREYGDWPLPWRAAACVVLALLAFGLPWSFLTRPTNVQWQALKSTEHEVQTRLQHVRQQVDALPALPTFTPDQSPLSAPNVATLITAIAETAHAAGLRDGQWRPQSPKDVAKDVGKDVGVEGIPIELRLHGTWPQLTRFANALAAPTWDAVLGLRDIRLRAQALTPVPVLELSATLLIYPHPVADLIPLAVSPTSVDLQRDPFADSSIGSRPTSAHAMIGRLHSGQEQVGLVLTADGQLRRIHARRKH